MDAGKANPRSEEGTRLSGVTLKRCGPGQPALRFTRLRVSDTDDDATRKKDLQTRYRQRQF